MILISALRMSNKCLTGEHYACRPSNVMPTMPNRRKHVGYQASGIAMGVNTRMFNEDVNDYDKLKKTLLFWYNFAEDGYRGRFRDVKAETDETPV